MTGDEQLQSDFRWTSMALGVLRIVTALLFLEHGTGKIFGFPYWEGMAFPPPWTMFWMAGLLETIGSLLLLVGLFTRPVAFVLAGEMAIAYWMIHAQESLFPMINKGEGAILFCFIFLLFVATGAGQWSIDAILRRRKPEYEGYAAPGGERQYSEDEFGGGQA